MTETPFLAGPRYYIVGVERVYWKDQSDRLQQLDPEAPVVGRRRRPRIEESEVFPD